MDSFPIPEPSLSSRAMLCSLSISMWSARKHDPDASEEIAVRHGAQADSGRYHKLLLPKQALAEIQKVVSEARQEHYFMTLPWGDDGYRVLPAAAYMDHVEKMRTLSNSFAGAVDTLARQFLMLVDQAKTRLGGLFREEDYPACSELAAKFSFETKVMPLPDAGDFRVALGDEEKDRIKRQITAAVEASLQVGSRELWQRLYEAVSHMAERLTAPQWPRNWWRRTGSGNLPIWFGNSLTLSTSGCFRHERKPSPLNQEPLLLRRLSNPSPNRIL
jgi:hypothetical protein